MSLDAGGLAQMTYNQFPSNGALGAPTASFSSRGKGAHLKRLSAAAQPKIGSISEHPVAANPTPRTSRGHLLAGLRTQPKTPGAVPASAPYNQTQFGVGQKFNGYNSNNGSSHGYGAPQTSIGSNFPMSVRNQYGMNAGQQVYSLPEHVLAPPAMQYEGEEEGPIDPSLAAQLMATEIYLQQRQQQLQQQLLSLTAQQLSGMNLNNGANLGQQQYPMTPMTPQSGYYGQMQNGVSNSLDSQPGLQVVYNPATGQYQYVLSQNLQQSHLSDSPPPPTPSYTNSPPKTGTPLRQASPPSQNRSNPFDRSTSPPKKSASPPVDVTPLPPPSANAFRRGHKKNTSSLAINVNGDVAEGPKSAFVRSVGFPQTPMTGTFGPGQARAGEHPVRQPRGPPPLEELQAAPTTKHEGSKNFATRQRRRAVHNLVRAGIERRGARSGSGGAGTPVSESDLNFPSDNDSDSVRSGSLSGKPSIGSLRAAASGAIGSERKASQERLRRNGSSDSYSARSVSSDDGASTGGKFVEVVVEEPKAVSGERRKTPMLVLTSAEKRKSSMF
ncbi:uncharacterized protein K452DRAFT_299323 [Aplosporella prunicola CBS 121167]|uniref:Uncharacterized protein n=1 Tax=Aplosporella prunicola CBS 121167 TaxID=1176127 RepID=A0A6A6B9A1_9PEZI|nr:uncharacterized protein K452DRAFT_299323 [Aplosporella prunicola CBS 121167]KAF2140586.1 hypothetical protein K452DRAFT_299323 [Aplosporella prunicola CBS 121167]